LNYVVLTQLCAKEELQPYCLEALFHDRWIAQNNDHHEPILISHVRSWIL
jgi:hypothetical protein